MPRLRNHRFDRRPVVALDPGHGAGRASGRSSRGMVGPSGLAEHAVTLSIAQAAARHLRGYGVVLTRDRGNNPSLGERAGRARYGGADVFVSIHAGGSTHGGTEAWVHPRSGAGCRGLARAIQHRIWGRRFGSAAAPQQGSLAVLSPRRIGSCAACLLEVENLRGRAGEHRLRDPAYIDRIGAAIAAGIRDHLGGAAAAGPRYGTTGPDVVANEADLRAYLDAVAAASAPRGQADDVDRAIEVVAHWEVGHAVFILPVHAKTALIEEMLGDPTRAGAEDAIFALLDGATDNELRDILMPPAGGLEQQLTTLFPQRMSTLTNARRDALQWITPGDDQIRDTFDSARIFELRKLFETNSQDANRDDCITVIKNTSPTLFGGDATVLREVDEAFDAIADLRVTFYGDEMLSRGLVVRQEFEFDPDEGNSAPTGLRRNPAPWDWMMTQIGTQEGWHVFLVGVFNGNHSATLFVEKRANATFAYWADQWTIGPNEDLDHTSGSTHGFRRYDEAGLHAHIEHYTSLWWNEKFAATGARWKTAFHLYKHASLP